MKPSYLEFEQPIADLQAKIAELSTATDDVDIDVAEEIIQAIVLKPVQRNI